MTYKQRKLYIGPRYRPTRARPETIYAKTGAYKGGRVKTGGWIDRKFARTGAVTPRGFIKTPRTIISTKYNTGPRSVSGGRISYGNRTNTYRPRNEYPRPTPIQAFRMRLWNKQFEKNKNNYGTYSPSSPRQQYNKYNKYNKL